MFSKVNVAIPTNSLFGQNDVYLGNINQQIEAPIKINSHSLNLHYIQELNNRGAKLNTDWDYFSFNNNKEQNSVSTQYDFNGQLTPSTDTENPNPLWVKNSGIQDIHVYTEKLI